MNRQRKLPARSGSTAPAFATTGADGAGEDLDASAFYGCGGPWPRKSLARRTENVANNRLALIDGLIDSGGNKDDGGKRLQQQWQNRPKQIHATRGADRNAGRRQVYAKENPCPAWLNH